MFESIALLGFLILNVLVKSFNSWVSIQVQYNVTSLYIYIILYGRVLYDMWSNKEISMYKRIKRISISYFVYTFILGFILMHISRSLKPLLIYSRYLPGLILGFNILVVMSIKTYESLSQKGTTQPLVYKVYNLIDFILLMTCVFVIYSADIDNFEDKLPGIVWIHGVLLVLLTFVNLKITCTKKYWYYVQGFRLAIKQQVEKDQEKLLDKPEDFFEKGRLIRSCNMVLSSSFVRYLGLKRTEKIVYKYLKKHQKFNKEAKYLSECFSSSMQNHLMNRKNDNSYIPQFISKLNITFKKTHPERRG